MPRFAMRITDEVLSMAKQLTGSEDAGLEGDMFVVIEALTPTKFTAEIMTGDAVFEEYKKDSDLQIF